MHTGHVFKLFLCTHEGSIFKQMKAESQNHMTPGTGGLRKTPSMTKVSSTVPLEHLNFAAL